MSSLLFLSNDDFHIQQGSKGQILCHEIQGFSFVLFYSKQCVYCQTLIPIFKQLPSVINGCQFAMMNVSLNQRIIEMSRQTITTIEYVPLMILYIHGQPYMQYKGPSDINEIRRFIVEVSRKLSSNQSTFFSKHVHESKKSIPTYSIATPLCGDDERCYLEYQEAYTGQKK